MFRKTAATWLFTAITITVACGGALIHAAPPAKPAPPLDLKAPDPLPAKIGDTEFDKMEADELFVLARSAVDQDAYPIAAIAQYWHVRKSGENRYDLACYLARLDKIDAAFYWLQ